MKLEPVIGLEIHVQLKTKSKMFCGCDNKGENLPPNTTICPICLGHPGTLPAVNQEAVNMGIRAAVALNLNINLHSKFDRKNYFYPDLPKGYQISQYDQPLAQNGYLEIESKLGRSKVGIERLHLEEDTGKLLHNKNKTLVDFNRAGTPLAEIVTKPEIKTPVEAKVFLQDLRRIMRYIDISEADMEKGHLRVDVNISLRPEGEDKLYTKVELKNLNSFRAVERGLEYEIKRLTDLWDKGEYPKVTSTRGWNDTKGVSEEQREKEAVHDYRYFPEPDLPPLNFSQSDIDKIIAQLSELPAVKLERFQQDYKISVADAKVLIDDIAVADYFEQIIKNLVKIDAEVNLAEAAKLTANWLINKLFQLLNEKNISLAEAGFTPDQFTSFLSLVATRRVNSTNAQLLLKRMMDTDNDPEVILEEEDLAQSNEIDLGEIINKVVTEYPEQVAQYQAGKITVLKFLLGAVMKKTKGKVNPVEIEELLKQKLV